MQEQFILSSTCIIVVIGISDLEHAKDVNNKTVICSIGHKHRS